MQHILKARETGYWPRSFNILTCRLFCPYGKLCLTEYASGRPSMVTREELYVIENDDIRSEGRSG
jgi:hypothetical protein